MAEGFHVQNEWRRVPRDKTDKGYYVLTLERAEEDTWPADKEESFDEFRARLRRTALGLEKSVIDAAFRSLHRRVEELNATGGEWTKDD